MLSLLLPDWISQIEPNAAIAAAANITLAVLGTAASVYEKWTKKHRTAILVSFVALGCIGAVTAIVAAAKSAQDLQAERNETHERNWRLDRPFGQWKARLSVKNIHLNDGNKEWIKKILAYAHRPNVMPIPNKLLIGPTSELYPKPDQINELSPLSTVMIEPSSEPGQYPNGNPNVLGFDLTPKPGSGSFVAHINDSKTEVTAFDLYNLEMTCEFGASTPLISNWIDLYGREMTLYLGDELGKGNYVGFSLFYDQPHELGYNCSSCVSTPEAGGVSFKRMLTEKELGPFPPDYKKLFPAQFKEIARRMGQPAL